ncbi:MAG TPA: hypothetical protein VLA20_06925, partial [Vicinamibacterales bacterium]|nr:hypothetical protein [Vicinamibacterales bacterium]
NWAGARSMTASSGPGLSLMGEFTGFGYYAEIPAVVWDIQRVGPSTGLPTRTAQGDVALVYTLSHGDTRHPILFPCSVADCFDYGILAFDLAERLQTPVFVLSDLDIGMNNWMSEPFNYPEKPWDRGKVLDAAALEKVENWGRYKDVDGDGIPYRTLPGIENPKGAYFTRGSGHDEMARYTENPEAFTKVIDRLKKKWETARTLVPPPVVEDDRTAKVGVIAYGSTHWAIVESRDQMRAQRLPTSYLLLKALPLTKEVEAFVKRHDRVYVVEQNRDGQMAEILKAELPGLGDRIRSVNVYDGLPINARTVSDTILEAEGLPPTPGMTTPAERAGEKAAEGATR